jgi:hypothetical protein
LFCGTDTKSLAPEPIADPVVELAEPSSPVLPTSVNYAKESGLTIIITGLPFLSFARITKELGITRMSEYRRVEACREGRNADYLVDSAPFHCWKPVGWWVFGRTPLGTALALPRPRKEEDASSNLQF